LLIDSNLEAEGGIHPAPVAIEIPVQLVADETWRRGSESNRRIRLDDGEVFVPLSFRPPHHWCFYRTIGVELLADLFEKTKSAIISCISHFEAHKLAVVLSGTGLGA
jgi:hypothetical protein